MTYDYSENILSKLRHCFLPSLCINEILNGAKINLHLLNMMDINSKIYVSLVGCNGNIQSDTFKLNDR